MDRRWLMSLLAMLVCIGAGIAGTVYVKHSVPKQLEASSLLNQPVSKQDSKTVAKSTQDIIYESQKLVVQIELKNGSIGSGFLYNKKGDVITNAHVVANAKQVTIVTADSKEMKGEVIGISRTTDIAVVRVPGLKGRTPLPIDKTADVELLTEVLALGSPLGLQNTVTTGEISGLNRNFELPPFTYENVYQISAPISPGNSGGPLLNGNTGEVMGINSAKLGQETIGFSIPILDILPMVKKWSQSPMKELPEFPELKTNGNENSSVHSTDADQATYIVQYFYDSINQGDFVTAYSLIGSKWQNNTTYEEFRAGYNQKLSVAIDHIVADPVEGEKVEVTAFVTTKETKNGSVEMKKYKYHFVVGYENDQMKIISGSGEQI
ncbi:S1C family serine protease [Halobacillus naozhouensis]|uniref:Trypsin-like peptidase domain-containing protein n=1 Tax=Halobacillus naozhouensis TaxID=554880 RepID=A0ABY8J1E6_9BACI|nr:trypsin-like peptidase domain-containing protein [Halobacillus naozhouensis]WFT76323.1 trypsin-like peptidase domain-containing protein [Halobacillus naozhouensis]